MAEGERETLTKDQLWAELERAESTKDISKLVDHAVGIGYSHDGRFITAAREKGASLTLDTKAQDHGA